MTIKELEQLKIAHDVGCLLIPNLYIDRLPS